MKQQIISDLQALIDSFASKILSTEQLETESPHWDSLVLFGCGMQGRKTLAGLREVGIEPLAFVDNNPKLCGVKVEGLEVVPPELAALRFPHAAYIMTIWSDRLGHPLGEVRTQMSNFGVSSVFSFTALSRIFPETFLPDFFMDKPEKLLSSLDDIKNTAEIWEDQYSLEEYIAQIKLRMTLDLEAVTRVTDYRAYFPRDLFTLSTEKEVFVDCGAFDGDTLKDFLKEVDSKFKKFIAVEPDVINYQRFRDLVHREYQTHSSKILPFNLAVGERRSIVRFTDSGSTESRIDDSGNIEVECRSLDELLENDQPTYIKMDIEGSERAALIGARKTIFRSRPVLAVSAYHNPADLWEIPLLISKMVSDYVYYLRPEKRAGWDLICYAVPIERSITKNQQIKL
jgi:FkbM family methyltransferase